MSDQSSDALRHGTMILACRRCSLNEKSLRYSLKNGYDQTSDFSIFNQGNLGGQISYIKILIRQNVLLFQLLQRAFRELSFGHRRQTPPQKQIQFNEKQNRCQRFCHHLFRSLSKRHGITLSHSSHVRVGQSRTASPLRTYHLSFTLE